MSGTGEGPYGEPPRWTAYRPAPPPAPPGGEPRPSEPWVPYTERHFGPTVVSEYDRGPDAADGLAVAALVVSLLGFFTLGVGFLAGLPLSVMAIVRTGDRPGRGFALAGLVISGFGSLMLLVVVGTVVWAGTRLWAGVS